MAFFIYLLTRRSEVIKRINSANLDVVSIEDLLGNDEKLGFASYVLIESTYLAFASSQMAPRVASFTRFINNLLERIGLPRYRFRCFPFIEQTSFEDALRLPYLSTTNIVVPSNHSLFEDFVTFFTQDVEQFKDVGSIEITIKPRGRANITAPIKTVLRNTSMKKTEKLMVRAKLESLDDALVDLYLAGCGQISDHIIKGTDHEISSQVRQAIKNNILLAQKVQEHENNDEFTRETPEDYSMFIVSNEWATRIRDL